MSTASSLRNIAAALERHFGKDPLRLTRSAVDVPVLSWFLSKMLGDEPITYASRPGVRLNDEERELTVRGTCSFLGYRDMVLTATLWGEQDDVSVKADAVFPAGSEFQLPGFSLFSIADLRAKFDRISFRTGDAEEEKLPTLPDYLRMRFAGNIHLPEAVIPVYLQKCDGMTRNWILGLDGKASGLSVIEDLAGIIGPVDRSKMFPAEVSGFLDQIDLESFYVSFDLERKRVTELGLSLSALAEPWTIVEKHLSVRDARLLINVRNPGDSDTRDVRVVVRGTVHFELSNNGRGPSGLDVPVRVAVSTRELSVRLGGSKSITLPSPADIAAMMCGAEVADSLPPQIASVGRLTVDEFSAAYDVQGGILTKVVLKVRAADEWQIVPEHFSVRRGVLRIAAENPTGNQKVTVGLAGIVKIAGIDVPVSVVRSEQGQWAFSVVKVRLPGITDVLTALGGGQLAAALPAGLSRLGPVTLNQMNLAFSETERRVSSIDAELRGLENWTPIETVDLVVDGVIVILAISADKKHRLRKIGGRVEGMVAVGGHRIALSAEYPGAGESLRLEGGFAAGESVSMAALVEDLGARFGEFDLPEELPDVTLSEIAVAIHPSTGQFSVTGRGGVEWQGLDARVEFSFDRSVGGVKKARRIDCSISLSAKGPVAVADELTIDKVDLVFSLSKGRRAAAWTASGTVSVKAFGTALDLQAAYRTARGRQTLTLSSNLKRPRRVVSLGGKGALTLTAFSMELTKGAAGSSWSVSGAGQVAITGAPKFAGKLTLSRKDDGTSGMVLKASEAWNFQIGATGLSVRNAEVNIQRTVRRGKKTVSGSIVGVVNIGRASITVAYSFPGDLVIQGEVGTLRLRPLINALCETGLLGKVPMPPKLTNLEFSNVVFSIAPQAKTFSLTGDTDLGRATLIVKKAKNRWGFGIAIVPPEDWKLSGLDNRLRSLDGLTFSKSALVLSSTDAPAFEIRRGPRSTSTVSVTKGLNFVAELSMAGLGVEELMKKRVRPLRVLAAIGSNPRKMILEVGIPGQVKLAKNFTFGDVRFRLRPSSPIPSIALVGVVTATLDKSPLRFIGAFTLEPGSASIQATMDGSWENPFGTKGVVISDVALRLGVSFLPFRPSEVGITGKLKVGDVTGSAAVNFDTKVPSHSMLAAEFTRLSPMDVLPKFLGPAAESRIPKGMTDILSEVTLRDVEIYIVPQATQIGELHYEQGLTVRGTIGVIRIGKFFELKGAGKKPRATLALVVKTSGPPRLEINGAVALLGMEREVDIAVSDKGFKFEMSGTIFGAFDCTVEAEGSSLKEGGDFALKVTMNNDLFKKLKDEASNAINSAFEGAATGIEKTIKDKRRRISTVEGYISDKWRWSQEKRLEKLWRVPEYEAYKAGRNIEIVALRAEIRGLEATRATLGAVSRAGQFIAKNGLNNLLFVHRASFESTLSAAGGGHVSLQLDLVFMGRKKELTLDFNFHDPVQSAKKLAKQLLSS